MKVGIIFNKAFQEEFGKKIKMEYEGKEITLRTEIRNGGKHINIKTVSDEGEVKSDWLNTAVIQLVYLGDWK